MSSTNMTIKSIASAIAALVILGAIYGAYQYPKAIGGQSSSSVTFSTAKFAAIGGINLASPGTTGTVGANGTSSSILNTDGTDRIITGLRYGCEGVGTSKTAYTGTGLASLQITAATSSVAGLVTNGNTNSVGGGAIVLATTTVTSVSASSTAPTASAGSSLIGSIWLAGSYLTFTSNATNTATCTFGADYIGS